MYKRQTGIRAPTESTVVTGFYKLRCGQIAAADRCAIDHVLTDSLVIQGVLIRRDAKILLTQWYWPRRGISVWNCTGCRCSVKNISRALGRVRCPWRLSVVLGLNLFFMRIAVQEYTDAMVVFRGTWDGTTVNLKSETREKKLKLSVWVYIFFLTFSGNTT